MYFNLIPHLTGNGYIDATIYASAALILGLIVHEIYWHITYRKEYSEEKSEKGTVTDMDYTAPRTSYRPVTIGKTTTISTTHYPEEHDVYITSPLLGDMQFDDEKLYQTVRIDDDIAIYYQEVYQVRRSAPEFRELMYLKPLYIVSPKGRKIYV